MRRSSSGAKIDLLKILECLFFFEANQSDLEPIREYQSHAVKWTRQKNILRAQFGTSADAVEKGPPARGPDIQAGGRLACGHHARRRPMDPSSATRVPLSSGPHPATAHRGPVPRLPPRARPPTFFSKPLPLLFPSHLSLRRTYPKPAPPPPPPLDSMAAVQRILRAAASGGAAARRRMASLAAEERVARRPAAERNVQWVFLGCPGVGKGTYASRLSRLLGVPHIATAHGGPCSRRARLHRPPCCAGETGPPLRLSRVQISMFCAALIWIRFSRVDQPRA